MMVSRGRATRAGATVMDVTWMFLVLGV